MWNILLLPWFQLIILGSSILLGSCLQAAEKLKACQTREGTWLECPAKTPEGIGSSYSFKKAVRGAKSKSPLVLLAGGPGQGASEAFLPMSQLISDLNNSFDLIFFDPRGTVKPHLLSCPMKGSLNLAALTNHDTSLQEAAHCVETLGRSFDLNKFGTDLSVQDLEHIRIDLGYQKLSLYGVSYGTRLALRYAALYPDRVDRILLEGVLPPEALIGQDTNFLEPVLKKLSDRCWQSTPCKEAYGDPWINYQKIIADFQSNKSLDVVHPRTGDVQSISLQSVSIKAMLLSLLYNEFDHTMLPAILHKAARGNFGPLLAAGFASSRSSVFEGLYYTIACSEDVPFYDDQKLDIRAKDLKKICEAYPFKAVDKSFHAEMKGDWPLLLLSGELDPVTSPKLLTGFKKNFPKARQTIVPGKGHNVYYLNCVAKQIRSFLEETDGKDQQPKPCEDVNLPFILPEPKP